MKQSMDRHSSKRRSKSRQTTYEQAITALSSSFYDTILRRIPNASRMELKVSALTSLNYSSSEIARMLCIASSTVDNHRYRIRKKLGLHASESLNQALLKLCGTESILHDSRGTGTQLPACDVQFSDGQMVITFKLIPAEFERLLSPIRSSWSGALV